MANGFNRAIFESMQAAFDGKHRDSFFEQAFSGSSSSGGTYSNQYEWYDPYEGLRNWHQERLDAMLNAATRQRPVRLCMGKLGFLAFKLKKGVIFFKRTPEYDEK